MKKRNIFSNFALIVFIFLLFFVNGGAEAYELTARSLGMGGAFSAIADDLEAILYNPASIANAGVLGLGVNTGISTYNLEYLEELLELYEDDEYGDIKELAGGIKEKAGFNSNVFVGARLNSIGLAYRMKQEHSINPIGDNYFSEKLSEGILSYGNQLLDPPFELGALYYGINLRYINIERVTYDLVDNLVGNAKGGFFSVDLGTLAKVTDNLRIACVVENALFTNPDLKGELKKYNLTGDEWSYQVINPSYSSHKDIKAKVRLGAALRIPIIDLTLAADLDNFLTAQEKQVLHLGLEKNLLLDALSIRLGKAKGEELDLNTFGLGLNLTGFNLDLALGKNRIGNREIIGLLSASMDF